MNRRIRKHVILFSLLLLFNYSFSQLPSGTYTIGGTNANFTTINNALDAMKRGVTGIVVFNIRDGIYSELLMASRIVPDSNFTVTFQSESLNPALVTIVSPDTTGNSIYIIRSERIIFKDITFRGSFNISFSNEIHFLNDVIYINKVCQISKSDSVLIENNIFYSPSSDKLHIGDSRFTKISRNKIFTSVYNIQSYKSTVINNYITGAYLSSHSGYDYVAFNNFCLYPEYEFIALTSYGVVENNNMPADFYYDYDRTTIFRNNNFPLGLGIIFDSNPSSIDPQYISTTDLRATNPQLIGKGIYSTDVTIDIEGTNRINPPTIGANEICFAKDTLSVYCGDSIVLSICNMPTAGNFTWSPIVGLSDINATYPKLGVSTSRWYYVYDSSINFLDSIYIFSVPFNVNAGNDDTLLYCGYSQLVLRGTHNASATYQWLPTDSLNTPNSFYTYARPIETTAYILTTSLPGCGVSHDTVNVFVDPNPIASVALASQKQNDICFSNYSTCADIYYWDFGDSIYSTEINPCHLYSDTGSFIVTLVACNYYSCDTLQGLVIVDSMLPSFIPETYDAGELLIYPNPADSYINITGLTLETTFHLYDLLGKEVIKATLQQGDNLIEINNLNSGIYTYRVFGASKAGKLFIER